MEPQNDKTDPIQLARAFGGLFSIMTLLGLLTADFFHPELVLSDSTIVLISALVTGLLGVDIVFTQRERIARALIAGGVELVYNPESRRRDRVMRATAAATQEFVGYEYDYTKPNRREETRTEPETETET